MKLLLILQVQDLIHPSACVHVHPVFWMPRCGDFPLFFPLFYCCQTPLNFVHENVMGTLKCPHNYGVVIVSHSYGDVPVPITLRLLTHMYMHTCTCTHVHAHMYTMQLYTSLYTSTSLVASLKLLL